MPESRSATRARLDPAGMALSTAGLTVLTYGVIEAGEHGWASRTAVVSMVSGALVLAGFLAWERHLARAGTRQPLVDLGLFRSRAFSMGTLLSTLLTFALIGLLFAAPQYLRAVLGFDAMEAGLRLLPMIGGMVVGLAAGDRISAKAGPKLTVTLGLAVAAAGLVTGAFTTLQHGTAFIATWITIVGLGTGLALPPAMNAALSELTGERSGVGSALVTAIRQVGGTFGVAVLGSVLNSAYRDRLDLAGLPARVADAVKDNVAAGVAVAERLGSPVLLVMVRSAFVHGMDTMLAVSGAVTAAGAVLALALLPGRPARRPGADARPDRAEESIPTTA
jgi:Na+/melibiose symporter-like transporter